MYLQRTLVQAEFAGTFFIGKMNDHLAPFSPASLPNRFKDVRLTEAGLTRKFDMYSKPELDILSFRNSNFASFPLSPTFRMIVNTPESPTLALFSFSSEPVHRERTLRYRWSSHLSSLRPFPFSSRKTSIKVKQTQLEPSISTDECESLSETIFFLDF
jgi:hypothetical protein